MSKDSLHRKLIGWMNTYTGRGALKVYELLKAWEGDIDELGDDGSNALHSACSNGNAESVAILLEAGADPNKKDFSGWTPLHRACWQFRSVGVIVILIKWGARINERGEDGMTPLMNAFFSKGLVDLNHIRFLLEVGADVTIIDDSGKNAIEIAEEAELDQEIIDLLKAQLTG